MASKTAARALISGPQAVQELEVYLRTMGLAQRRWARQIALQENEVRRLMLLEEHHRERVRQSALRDFHTRLARLSNTDLATAAAHVAPTVSAPQLLQACGVTAAQINAFSVYALARLAADPDRLDVCTRTNLTNVIADFQSEWDVVSPTKKTAYSALAGSMRAHWRSAPPGASSPLGNPKPRATKGARRPAERHVESSSSKSDGAGRARDGASRPRRVSRVRARGQRQAEPWETTAFRTFCGETKQLFASALGCTSSDRVSEVQWLPIARAEWASKTLRQKRLYYTQDLGSH